MGKFCQYRGPDCLCSPEGGLLRPYGSPWAQDRAQEQQTDSADHFPSKPSKPVARPTYRSADLPRDIHSWLRCFQKVEG